MFVAAHSLVNYFAWLNTLTLHVLGRSPSARTLPGFRTVVVVPRLPAHNSIYAIGYTEHLRGIAAPARTGLTGHESHSFDCGNRFTVVLGIHRLWLGACSRCPDDVIVSSGLPSRFMPLLFVGYGRLRPATEVASCAIFGATLDFALWLTSVLTPLNRHVFNALRRAAEVPAWLLASFQMTSVSGEPGLVVPGPLWS